MKPWVLWIGIALCALGCSTGNESLLDFDGDGSLDENDCDSTDAQIYPGAADAYGDEIDSNCDGIDGVDADGGVCDCPRPSGGPGASASTEESPTSSLTYACA